MKTIIKKVEKIVLDSMEVLESFSTDKPSSEQLNGWIESNIFVHISTNYIDVEFQYDTTSCFRFTCFSDGKNALKKIIFNSGFYDLEEKQQLEMLDWFLNNYPNAVALFTDGKNLDRKKELYKQQKEIAAELETL